MGFRRREGSSESRSNLLELLAWLDIGKKARPYNLIGRADRGDDEWLWEV
jgi:hypothetical protein